MPKLSKKYKMILMIIAPLAIVGLSLGIYYGINKEKFKSCTCAKDNQNHHVPEHSKVQEHTKVQENSKVPEHETYTYTNNQQKTDICGSEIKLRPVNDFAVSESQTKERYSTAYYKEPQNNPEINSRFSGV